VQEHFFAWGTTPSRAGTQPGFTAALFFLGVASRHYAMEAEGTQPGFTAAILLLGVASRHYAMVPGCRTTFSGSEPGGVGVARGRC